MILSRSNLWRYYKTYKEVTKIEKIGLTEGFSLIPEGSHVFQITEVKYKEDFGKMEVTMQTATGQKHTERFSLLDKDGEVLTASAVYLPVLEDVVVLRHTFAVKEGV